jgi:hypothetical protein
MSFSSDGDKLKAIKYGIDSAFWQLWYLPELDKRAKLTLDQLATKKSDDDDIKRGFYQGLKWAMSIPATELMELARRESEAQETSTIDAEDDLRVTLGRNAPFRVALGELKEEDAAVNPAAQES